MFSCLLICFFLLQSFVVSLVNPQDGVVIGDMSSVTVTINRNDDINGVFIFDMDSVLVSICNSIMNESFTVMFSVTRIPNGAMRIMWSRVDIASRE